MSAAQVFEGVVYDPTADSGRMAIKTDEGDYVYIEDELPQEGSRVRVTIEDAA